MGLSEFIQATQEAIVAAFEAYVLSHVPPGVDCSPAEARDHAGQVLAAISWDMRQRSLLHGDAPAQRHGRARHTEGFDIEHVLGEYRMLRVTVMRRWLGSRPSLGAAGVEDLVRFNEAVDQAVAESVGQFESDSNAGSK